MTPTPPPAGPPADEDDPTGIRDLLRSLPDPGPMPAALSDRITAALADEQRARVATTENVRPLVRPADGVRREAGSPSTSRAGVPTWMKAVGGLAAAAAIAGVTVVGIQAGRNDAPTSAVPTATPTGSQSGNAAGLEDRVVVERTGVAYTQAGLATQAAALVTGTPSSTVGSSETSLGSMVTAAGVLACARSIGINLLDNPDSIKVDLSTYDGQPAAIVVSTKSNKSTAWVVSRSCTTGSAPLAGPTAVTT